MCFPGHSPRSCSERQPLLFKGSQQSVKKRKRGEESSEQRLVFLFSSNLTFFPLPEEITSRKHFGFLYQFEKGIYFPSWLYQLATRSINIAANCTKMSSVKTVFFIIAPETPLEQDGSPWGKEERSLTTDLKAVSQRMEAANEGGGVALGKRMIRKNGDKLRCQ